VNDSDDAILAGPNLEPLRGRRFCLIPLAPRHLPLLYELSVIDQSSFRWRFRGRVPPMEAFVEALHSGVLCQFAIVPTSRPDDFAGLVVAYSYHPQGQYCYLAVLANPAAGAGVLEGVALFLRYLFRFWPLRKIYLEVPEFNLPQYQSAVTAGLLKQEGCLVGHDYFAGRHWDLFIYAIYRSEALRFGHRFASLFDDDDSSGQGLEDSRPTNRATVFGDES